MKLKNIDLNLFSTFEVIYDTGSLTQAARLLNITQPAVSNALARLRDQIEDPLFVHAGGRMNPTATADELIEPVRQALSLLRGSVERKVGFDPRVSKKLLRLSIGDIGEMIILPKFIEILRDQAPNMEVQVFQVERRSLGKMLATNEIDFAIDIPMPLDGHLRQVRFSSDHQVCAVSEAHPLACKEELTLDDYLACDHIHVSSRKKGGGVADMGLGKLGVRRNSVLRLQHYQAAFAILQKTDFVLTAPASLARLYSCKTFPVPFEAPNLDLHLYWHKAAERSDVSKWVRQKLVEAAGGAM